MKGFPIVFDIFEKSVVVVGAGSVATRRIGSLVDAGAEVTVVAPAATGEIESRARRGDLRWQRRPFERGDLQGAALVLAATDDRDVNERVARRAQQLGIAVGVADDPSRGDFTVPARLEFDHLRLTVDTGGAGPAISSALRRHLEQILSPGWQRAAEIAAILRPVIAKANEGNTAEFWRAFAADLPGACEGEVDDIATWIDDLANRRGIDLGDIDIRSCL